MELREPPNHVLAAVADELAARHAPGMLVTETVLGVLAERVGEDGSRISRMVFATASGSIADNATIVEHGRSELLRQHQE